MSQQELEVAVAAATGESLALIHELGFGLANPVNPQSDPEPYWPQVFDWDCRAAVFWPLP
jgi:hypothetical protein